MTVTVLSPIPGRVVPMQEVPDPVFAGDIVGPGIAVDPPRSPVETVSPVAGRLVKLHPHAFVVLTDEGAGVLVHLGIDTVQLKGEGFTLFVDEGMRVEAGQRMVGWDPAAVEAGGRSPISPVVVLDTKREALSDLAAAGEIEAGAPLFTWST